MSSSEPSQPHFSGEGGRACELFIRDVRANAFARGKQRDEAWQADFAAMCLDGVALRWYDELNRDVQQDWPLLRRALLERWPLEDEYGGQSQGLVSDVIPTPAAAPPIPARAAQAPQAEAAPAPTAPRYSTADFENSGYPIDGAPPVQPVPYSAPVPVSRVRRGRIKVRRGQEVELRYVRRTAGWMFGQYRTTSKVGDALVVEWNEYTRQFNVINGPEEYPFIGINWTTQSPVVGKGSIHHAYVTPVTATFKTKANVIGPVATRIWCIDQSNRVQAFYRPEGSVAATELDFMSIDNTLFVAADQAAYSASKGSGWQMAECTFEDI